METIRKPLSRPTEDKLAELPSQIIAKAAPERTRARLASSRRK